jgi:hypothetical protein
MYKAATEPRLERTESLFSNPPVRQIICWISIIQYVSKEGILTLPKFDLLLCTFVLPTLEREESRFELSSFLTPVHQFSNVDVAMPSKSIFDHANEGATST